SMRDVINLDPATVTSAERSYWFKAHLDFVVFDAETSEPRFAVEYDGRQHVTDAEQMRRDEMKDRLCEMAGLPLLRIDSNFMRTINGYQVWLYGLEAHDLALGFFKAQTSGWIPWDEPFSHTSFINTDSQGRLNFNGLDRDAIKLWWEIAPRLGVRSEVQWW